MHCWVVSSGSQCPSDGGEVGGHDSPAYPPLEARLAAVTAAPEVAPTFEHADPSLPSGPEAHGTPEPPLVLVGHPLGIPGSWFGQSHPRHPHLLGSPLRLRRVDASIRREERRGPAEATPVLL